MGYAEVRLNDVHGMGDKLDVSRFKNSVSQINQIKMGK